MDISGLTSVTPLPVLGGLLVRRWRVGWLQQVASPVPCCVHPIKDAVPTHVIRPALTSLTALPVLLMISIVNRAVSSGDARVSSATSLHCKLKY
eukprot:3564819-Rhodomonas_salina.1